MRNYLTLKQKLELRSYARAHPQASKLEMIDWVQTQFHVTIGRSTLHRIQNAPESAFTGRLTRKRGRRVKFPAFEDDLRSTWQSVRLEQQRGLSDESLLQLALQLRAKHGIGESDLRLSNGWLHKFKERCAFECGRWQATTGSAADEDEEDAQNDHDDDDDDSLPDAITAEEMDHALAQQENGANPEPLMLFKDDSDSKPQTESVPATDPTAAMALAEYPVAPSDNMLVVDDVQPASLQDPMPDGSVEPLIYLSVKSISSVRAPGVLNWELKGGYRAETFFTIVNDGIRVLQDAVYQVNVDLEHSLSLEPFAQVFKVWADATILGVCTAPLRCDNSLAMSVFEFKGRLAANTKVRVEFDAPGFALPQSSLVIRLMQ